MMETLPFAFDGRTTSSDEWRAPSAAAPLAVLVHGFGGQRTHMRHHAEALAREGYAVVAPDMSSLLPGPPAQVRNIAMVVAHVQRLIAGAPPATDAARVLLVGHSAGGAVVLEAAVALAGAGQPAAAVVLLDAVPWPRTRTVAATFPCDRTLLISIRSAPSAWNLQGAIAPTLAHLAGNPRYLDVALPRSRHGDPVRPAMGRVTAALLGLLGPPEAADAYVALLVAVAKDMASPAGVPAAVIDARASETAATLATLTAAGIATARAG